MYATITSNQQRSPITKNVDRVTRGTIRLEFGKLEPYLRVYSNVDFSHLELFHSIQGWIFNGERDEYQGEFKELIDDFLANPFLGVGAIVRHIEL